MLGKNGPSSTVVHPGYVAGRFYPCSNSTVAGGTAVTASNIRAMPFTISKPITVSALGARVTTASASGNFQLAIYAHDPAAVAPTGAALCSTASLSTTSATALSGAVTSVTLQPGTYWMAVNQDNSTAAYQTLAAAATQAGYIAGSTTLATVSSANATATYALSVAQTYGTWPDLTSASFTEVSGATNALVYMKAA
jgi:multisubunit Na+/H+ antiporter MnhE subunit